MQGTRERQNNLEKGEQDERAHTFQFQTAYKATGTKTVWWWGKDRPKSMGHNSEPDRNPYMCGQLISDKGANE